MVCAELWINATLLKKLESFQAEIDKRILRLPKSKNPEQGISSIKQSVPPGDKTLTFTRLQIAAGQCVTLRSIITVSV